MIKALENADFEQLYFGESSFGCYMLHFTTIHRGELLCLCSSHNLLNVKRNVAGAFSCLGAFVQWKKQVFAAASARKKNAVMPSAPFRLEDYVTGCSGCDVRVRTA